MAAVHVRIDEKTKKAATKVLNKVGLDMSSAIKLYLHQIILRKGVPFRVVTENGLTLEEEEAILKASAEAKNGKNVTRAKNWKESKTYLDELKKKK